MAMIDEKAPSVIGYNVNVVTKTGEVSCYSHFCDDAFPCSLARALLPLAGASAQLHADSAVAVLKQVLARHYV